MGKASVIARRIGLDKPFSGLPFTKGGKGPAGAVPELPLTAALMTETADLGRVMDAAIKASQSEIAAEKSAQAISGPDAADEASVGNGQVSAAVQTSVASLFAKLDLADEADADADGDDVEPPSFDETKMVLLLSELNRLWRKSAGERVAV
jgi:hypothetical protein